MESEEKPTKSKIKLERVIGIILLIPPIISGFVYLMGLFMKVMYGHDDSFNFIGESIYLGLMAIAGAMLLKRNRV
jgi:hypothetical protein